MTTGPQENEVGTFNHSVTKTPLMITYYFCQSKIDEVGPREAVDVSFWYLQVTEAYLVPIS